MPKIIFKMDEEFPVSVLGILSDNWNEQAALFETT